MKRITTIISFLLLVFFSYSQMYVWQNGALVGDYAEGVIDSVKFVKPEPQVETLRNEPTEGGLL